LTPAAVNAAVPLKERTLAGTLILKMSISLDGFVAGPRGEMEWAMRTLDAAATRWIEDTLWTADIHIMGSRTYRDMLAYWPTSAEPLAAPMNKIPKAVFTRDHGFDPAVISGTTTALTDAVRLQQETGSPRAQAADGWTHVRVADGDLTDEIAQLKAESPKAVIAHGGASLARALVRAQLVDEYRLLIHPVALGTGLPLFSGLPAPLHLAPVSAESFPGGVTAQTLQPA
jgi:dihydrofolate reductase